MRKIIIMVPIEITISEEGDYARELYHDFKHHGPYPEVIGGRYQWRARFDHIRLADIRSAVVLPFRRKT